MLQSLDLHVRAETGVAAERGALGQWRGEGANAVFALSAADGAAVSLGAGAYEFLLGLVAEDALAPRLMCEAADGKTRAFALEPAGQGAWRCAFVLAQGARALRLNIVGARGAFLITHCRVQTEAPDAAPTLAASARDLARALFRKAPRPLRNALGQAIARGRAKAHVQAAAKGGDAALAAGDIRVGGSGADAAELEARRADFDARFSVARGLADAPAQPAPHAAGHGARAIAFYLPQFHRIAENDAWWGAGFTEWTNVAKAVPQFAGHHQPRLPGELGFYDLTAPEALSRQVELARSYGVSAFCFHYYWFGGARLLERPLDAFAADRALDLGFTLCWANENWTRRWDGADDAVLIAQKHSAEDHARVFDDMARYLEDPRALRIEGRPLIIVYRPAIIGDARQMTDIWRERASARGWPGVFIAATDAFLFDDPLSLGFDGLVEFPPHGLAPEPIGARLSWLNPRHGGVVFDYRQTAEDAIARLGRRGAKGYAHFPGVMPSWDNEARRPGAGTVFHDASPEAYARWLAAACANAARTLPEDRRLVFVNAWNEWAEGAYLEPDRKWGRAFLGAHAAVMGGRA